mgnify:CR=1 FL=1
MPSDEQTDIVPWVLAGIVSIVGALTTALVYVVKKIESDNATSIKKLELENESFKAELTECKEDRAKIFTELELLKDRIVRMDKDGTKFSHKYLGDNEG